MIAIEPTINIPFDLVDWKLALIVPLSYLYGSIPFSLIFTYILTGKRLDTSGTGNIGVANAFGTGGLICGFLSVLADASKGLLPVLIANYIYDGSLFIALTIILFVITGHGYSIFLKGKGGQGDTIIMWALVMLSPFTVLAYLILAAVTYFLIGRNRLARLTGYALLPFEILLIEQNMTFFIFGVIIAVYYMIRYDPQRSDYNHYKTRMKLLRFMDKRFKTKSNIFIPLKKVRTSDQAGFKAFGVKTLNKMGYEVPVTYVCPFSVYERYKNADISLVDDIRGELSQIIEHGKRYCVRSSANLEDSDSHSFAGQFLSFLELGDLDQIVESIIKVWESVNSDTLDPYLQNLNRVNTDLRMAVIVQEMVDAIYTGVVFTRNPINGFDEIIIEAVSGMGDKLNEENVLFHRWVYKWGTWLEKPAVNSMDEELSALIVSQSQSISKKYGQALDLEWAFDGQRLVWLQLRPITSIKGINIYSNKISREFLPGMIKPLVWSINIPVVNTSWKQLLIELLGNDARGIEIENLAKSIYYRAYFNMGKIGDMFELLGMSRELLELLIGIEIESDNTPVFRPGIKSIKYLPGMLLFVIKCLRFKTNIRHFLVDYEKKFGEISRSLENNRDENEVLTSIEILLALCKQASYFVIVTILLMGFFNRILKKQLEKRNYTEEVIDLTGLRKRLIDIDPDYHLSELKKHYETLQEVDKENFRLANSTNESSEDLRNMGKSMDRFIHTFGHLSDSGNDFSKPQWQENQSLIRNMVTDYKTKPFNAGQGNDLRLDTQNGMMFRYILRNAIEYREYRERVNYVYTWGYSLFRQHFLSVSTIWKQKGFIDDENDIFYLSHQEIIDFQKGNIALSKIQELISQRKNDIQRLTEIRLPSVIVGDSLPPVIYDGEIQKVMRGIPASRGYCTGKISLIRSLNDFSKEKANRILVIPHSDASWTPLFHSALGVISESGGGLSHCAIIAREYGIPAVVSVKDALKLKEDTLVTLDGDKGEVTLLS